MSQYEKIARLSHRKQSKACVLAYFSVVFTNEPFGVYRYTYVDCKASRDKNTGCVSTQ